MFLFAIHTTSCKVLRWGIESRHLIWMHHILNISFCVRIMGSYEPFHLVTKRIHWFLFCTCALLAETRLGAVIWLLKNPWSSHNQYHTLCAVTFFTGERTLSTGVSFIIFWQRFLNWIRSVLDQWLIYFLFQNAPFQSSVLIPVAKKSTTVEKKTLFVIPERLIYWLGQWKHV